MHDAHQNKLYYFNFIVFFFFLFPIISQASTTIGTIGSTTNAAWSNNLGWINFAPTNGGLTITASTVTGSAWSQTYGWIKFTPANGGVSNDGQGHLSGTAWGENFGWVSFSGVSINSTTGKFTGTATGPVIGTLTFDCLHCDVETDWRPASVNVAVGGSGDTVRPIITILGNNPDIINIGSVYTDAGATSTDNLDGDITSKINTTGLPINTSATGTFAVVYTVSDTSGNKAVATRTVEVIPSSIIDMTPPVITITGGTPTTVIASSTYIDKGATAIDDVDGVVPVIILSNDVNTDQIGAYSVVYEATDTTGNIAYATRTVNVIEASTTIDNIPPVITVKGGTPITITIGSAYTDQGATAKDNLDGSIPVTIIKDNVDTNTVGTYEVTYTATDVAGNTSTVTRTVNVIPEPIINPETKPTSPSVGGSVVASSTPANNPTATSTVLNETVNSIKDVYNTTFSAAKDVAKNTKEFVNTGTGSVVTKTISTLGVATGLSLPIAAATASFSDLWLILARLFGFFLELFGLKKKNRPWGTVYDSITKRPLDPVYVSLINTKTNEEVDSAITDIDGRYGFAVVPGTYKIEAKKTNYTSPSLKMKGRLFDEVYNDLYFGGEIVITDGDETIGKNIPMDSISFNWNEFAKTKMDVNKFIRGKDVTWARISKALFFIGAIVSFIALVFAPAPYNFIVAGFYVLAYILNYIVFKTKKSGVLTEKNTNIPLSFAIVDIFREGETESFTKKIANEFGAYYALLPNGKYFIKVEKKNNDETYTEILKTPLVDVTKGILNLDFKI